MTKRAIHGVGVALLVAVAVCIPAEAQVCEPVNDGHVADASYEGGAVFWSPVVEYRKITLTISGPCEDIVKTFGPKDLIMFDLREIQGLPEGQYTWTLKREATVAEDVRKNLREARLRGNERAVWQSHFQAGKIPAGPYTQTGFFSVFRGQIVDPTGEEKVATDSKGARSSGLASATIGGFASGETARDPSGNALSSKVVLTNANGVIRNSLCVGFDCPDSPAFGDSTIILSENNTRIKFADTSMNAFPSGDWEIEANSNLNGGPSYLAFNDCGPNDLDGDCTTDLVFGVEAGARQRALWIEADGDVSFGTANPVVELHAVRGDTPTLRLDQDASSGFQPQVWDVAGNETSFFIRDATNGSTLPFRIRPGAASNALVIDTDSDVGIGVLSPAAALEISRGGGGAAVSMVRLTNTNGPSRLEFRDNGASDIDWDFRTTGGDAFVITQPDSPTNDMLIANNGNVTIRGMLTEGSSRTIKEGFESVDGKDVLARLAETPISTWAYTGDGARHIGPMAEDFYATFGFGADDKHIAPGDKAGVALAAVQGLNQIVAQSDAEKDARIEALEAEIETLKSALRALTEQK